MTECRHGIDLNEYDCMNCDSDTEEFLRWWVTTGLADGNHLSEYKIAKEARFAGIQHIIVDMAIGL